MGAYPLKANQILKLSMIVWTQLEKDAKPMFVATTYTDIMLNMLTSMLRKLFKTTTFTTIFTTNNCILKILRYNNNITPLESKTGRPIHKLSCDGYNCFYISQTKTRRGFLKRFNEHTPKHYFKNQNYYLT